NISPDHLDRHGTMELYCSAKRRIVEFQDSACDAIINSSDPVVFEWRNATKARVRTFSRIDASANYTIFQDGGERWLVEQIDHKQTLLAPAKSLTIPGEFQLVNALCAAAAARAFGATAEAVAQAIAHFRGVAHRLQLLPPVRGVRFYDNAVSTVPESTITALESVDGPIRWIAGGKSKGLDLTKLAEAAKKLTIKSYLYGEAARELLTSLERAGAPAEMFQNLSGALAAAWAESKPGDAIVYSPAFPSFDQYRNYKDRGAEFLHFVAKLRAESDRAGLIL
ncbi:MAG: UDP-N-acetylmuramoyl-L-alanine--D-glutamate ligase, partial [Planctomycetota bacterium]